MTLTAALLAGILLAHFLGDYVIQSDWMANEKTKRIWPAIVHGLTYTIPYAFITHSPLALFTIAATHVVIDRWRLPKYLIWFKNQFAPKDYRYPWHRYSAETRQLIKDHKRGTVTTGTISTASISASTITAASLEIGSFGRTHKLNDGATGYPDSTPTWMAVWLLIIVDNVAHLVINTLSVLCLH